VNSKTLWYLTSELKDLKVQGSVEGKVGDWSYEIDSETRKSCVN
jgi:hypothetical protein